MNKPIGARQLDFCQPVADTADMTNIITADDLKLALLDAFEPKSSAQAIVDLTDVARAASTLAPEDVKQALISAAQYRRYVIRRES